MSQLFLLWNNALPKSSNTKDATLNKGKTELDWLCLLECREAALGALCNFLHYNLDSLESPDIGKRIAALLNNSLSFVTSLPSNWSQFQSSSSVNTMSLLPISDLDRVLRRRLFDCYTLLNSVKSFETSWSHLLKACLDNLMICEILSTSSLSSSVWSVSDPNGLGITSLIVGNDVVDVHKTSSCLVGEIEEDMTNRHMLWETLENLVHCF
jgi:hypothetical protein